MFKRIANLFNSNFYDDGFADGYAQGMRAFTEQGVIIAHNPALDEIMVEEPNGDWNRYKRVAEVLKLGTEE